jgi:nucleotide-binding universal stress UspA family protein
MADSLFSKILVANDGSEGARKALAVAIELAQRYEADLHVITAEEHLPQHQGSVGGGELRSKSHAADYLRNTMIQAGMFASNHGTRVIPHVLSGHEVETIATFLSKERFDLLVVGLWVIRRSSAMSGEARLRTSRDSHPVTCWW